MKMLDRLHERIAHLLSLVAEYRPGRSLFEQQSHRMARNLIRLCLELGVNPQTIVDVGAHNSEVSMWLAQQWPEATVISCEPDSRCHPIGTVVRKALSDHNHAVAMTSDGDTVCPHISDRGEIAAEAVRFDWLWKDSEIKRPSLAKIDAENHSVQALRGFGSRIKDFDVVVIEVVNHFPTLPYLLDYERTALVQTVHFMAEQGFSCSRILDAGAFFTDFISHVDVAFWKCQ